VPSEVVGLRYAEALISLIEDSSELDGVNQELKAVAEVVTDNFTFRTFLEAPNVRTEDKLALFEKVFGDKVHSLVMDYLKLLVHKDRIDHLGESAKQFQRLVEARRNQVRVKVVTAVPLPVDVADRLKRTLDGAISMDCILENKVDAKILGGVIVQLGDRVVDGSIRTGLDEMKKSLMAAAI
jgi:F-type H+-transporting ATPase subunit delta